MKNTLTPARLQLIKEAIKSQEKYLAEIEQIRQQWRTVVDQEAKEKGEPIKISSMERKYLFEYGDINNHQ